MAEEIKSGADSGAADDPIANLKSEFNRKFENQQKELKTLSDTNASLSAQLKQIKPAAPTEPKKKPLDQIFYEDPEAHARILKDQAKAELKEELRQEQAQATRTSQAMAKMANEYPELTDQNSDLTKKTLEIYNAYSDDEKRDPKALRLAAFEAVQDLGVKPMSKRTDDEIFSLSQGGGNRPPRRGPSDKLDARTEDLAAVMGLDYRDPKVAARLKERAQRKNYKSYQSNKLVGSK